MSIGFGLCRYAHAKFCSISIYQQPCVAPRMCGDHIASRIPSPWREPSVFFSRLPHWPRYVTVPGSAWHAAAWPGGRCRDGAQPRCFPRSCIEQRVSCQLRMFPPAPWQSIFGHAPRRWTSDAIRPVPRAERWHSSSATLRMNASLASAIRGATLGLPAVAHRREPMACIPVGAVSPCGEDDATVAGLYRVHCPAPSPELSPNGVARP